LPASDARVRGTVKAIEERLMDRGLVRRYQTDPVIEGLPRGEGAFLPSSFWLADTWAMMGRHADASALFKRLVALCNDVGLLSEEYDPAAGRMLGNFPQAFSHVSLVNTAHNLVLAERSPARRRHARHHSALELGSQGDRPRK
jgi:GH15 family glucan-1,4-alpha-glucosidase